MTTAATIGAMKRLHPLILGLAVAVLPACYESPVPLDPAPQADIDARVVGAWRCLPPDPDPTDTPANLTVTRTRDRVYEAVFATADDDDPDRYEAYASVVKGRQVVNVRELSGTSRPPWTFMQYTLLRPDVLEILIASDDVLKDVAPTPSALRKRMEGLADDPRLFSGYCICVRQKKTDPAQGQEAAATGVDVAAERAALVRADKAWSDAAAARDVETVLSYWTDDATVYPPGQPAVVGTDALRRYVTGGFALPGFSIGWETHAFEVSASGDMAYGVGTNVVTINDAQGRTITERGRAVTVWRKDRDGKWRCVVDIWNAGPGASPPPD
jgi:ketosteroid isomerase-like protein